MKENCTVCLGNICRSPMAEFVMKELNRPAEIEAGQPRAGSTVSIHQGTQAILRNMPFLMMN